MGNFAILKFNPCCSVYPRTAARQIRSYGSSAENPSAPAIGAQYLNVLPIMETLVFALEEAAAITGRNFLPTCTFCTPHFFYINSNKTTAGRTKTIHRRLELSFNLYLLLLFVGQNRASKKPPTYNPQDFPLLAVF